MSAVYGTMAGSVFCMLREPFFLLLQVGWMQFRGTPGFMAILPARKQNIMPGLQRLWMYFVSAERVAADCVVLLDRAQRFLSHATEKLWQHWPNPCLRLTLQLTGIISVIVSVCRHVLVNPMGVVSPHEVYFKRFAYA